MAVWAAAPTNTGLLPPAAVPNYGPIFAPHQKWLPNTAYALGTIVLPTTPNGHYYRVTTAGTSHASTEPTWVTNGATNTDGTAVWTDQGLDLEATALPGSAADWQKLRWVGVQVGINPALVDAMMEALIKRNGTTAWVTTDAAALTAVHIEHFRVAFKAIGLGREVAKRFTDAVLALSATSGITFTPAITVAPTDSGH